MIMIMILLLLINWCLVFGCKLDQGFKFGSFLYSFGWICVFLFVLLFILIMKFTLCRPQTQDDYCWQKVAYWQEREEGMCNFGFNSSPPFILVYTDCYLPLSSPLLLQYKIYPEDVDISRVPRIFLSSHANGSVFYRFPRNDIEQLQWLGQPRSFRGPLVQRHCKFSIVSVFIPVLCFNYFTWNYLEEIYSS